MKHVLYILFFFIAFVNNSKAQKACCPEFRIVADYEACEKRDTSGTYGQKECNIRACKNSNQVYTVFPIKTGYSYTWTISGGTLLNSNTNPVKIKWGTGTEAVLQVIITSPDKSCKDTIKSFVCLTDAPVAGFGFVPGSPVCKNQLLQFNNTSAGAMSYSWNFGDGTASNQTNPSHSYTAAGTYIVTLAVSTDTSKTGPVQGEGACACRDTTRKIIVVKNEDPLQIESGCKKMLCKGDTATYCTPNNCNNYNWSVTGGRISGSTSGKCITVIWDGSYPATVTLNSNCGGSCGNTATINVPVLYPNMNILGPVIVCPGSLSNYSLPAMPGTFYKWTITGSGTISGFTENTNNINVLAQNSGSFTINCAYQNPATKCSGTASITVQIKPKFKILGPKKVCVGDTEPYKVIDNSPANWTLTPNTGITPPGPYNNVGSINITWHKPGTYKLFASPVNTNNFCSYPDEIQIIVNDTPKLNAITGSKMICPGSSAVYKISSNINDGTFYWTPLNGVKQCLGSRCDSVMVTWNATGPYSIKVHQITDAGCSSSDKELAVDTFPKPIINGPQQVCADAEATYTATGPVPASGYNWTINSLGSIISGQGTNSIKVLWSGGVTAGFNTAIISISTCAANTNSFVPPMPGI